MSLGNLFGDEISFKPRARVWLYLLPHPSLTVLEPAAVFIETGVVYYHRQSLDTTVVPALFALSHIALTHLGVFYAAVEAQKVFERSLSIVFVRPEAYDAIFITGGYGIAWDGTFNSELKKLIERAYRAGRIIATVGHGSGTLIQAEDSEGNDTNNSIVFGRQVILSASHYDAQ